VRSLLFTVLAALAGFGVARWVARSAAEIALPREAAPAVASQATPAAAPPALDAAKPITERLRNAFRGSSPLASAARALAELDAMTADDFRKLTAKPGEFYPPSVYGHGLEFSRAFMDVLVARWLEVDPTGAFPAMQALEAELKKRSLAGNGDFAAAFARVRPDLVLGALPEKASWERFDQIIPTAFTALASRDPAAARGHLGRIADPDQRKEAEVAIAQGIAQNDPVAAVALARMLESTLVFDSALEAAERIGVGVLREVLVANQRKFPIGFNLTELVLRYPEEDWSAFVNDAPEKSPGLSGGAMREAQRYTPEQRQQVLARLDEFPSGVRTQVSTALIHAWARDDAPQATAWAYARATAGPGEDAALSWAFNAWRGTDHASAVDWWSRLPASPLRDRLGSGIASALAVEKKFGEAIQYFQPKAGGESAELTANIARAGADHDPVRVAHWLDAMPPDIDTTKAMGPVLEAWVRRDADAAAQWVEAQPPGQRRDAALQAYTRAAAGLDPAAAAEWVAAIADPQMRAAAAEHAFAQLDRSDPTAARAWLRTLPGVDAAWRERLIRLGR
jgi:hypothetical protein